VPRYSETTYEVHWLDGSNDPQYFDGANAKDMAIRTAREAKANGDEVEVIKSVATWGDKAAAGSLAPIDTKESVVRFSHTITLPKGKRRLNIDEATAALAQMGYRLGNVRYDPAAGGSVYKVTQPNGSVVDMPAAKLTDFIYQKAQHMKNGTKARMSQISQMLDTLESQANDQPDLAKKNIQKMVDHVAHEGTRDEFMRLVKIADRLGLRGLMSRAGAKKKFGRHKVDSYGPFEIWWVGEAGGSRYFEVKKGSMTTTFDDSDRAERYIAQNGGIAYLVQKYFKDFWNNGFGDFVTSHRPMDKMTKRDLQIFLKDAIEMYEDEEDPQGVQGAKKVMQFLTHFSRTGEKSVHLYRSNKGEDFDGLMRTTRQELVRIWLNTMRAKDPSLLPKDAPPYTQEGKGQMIKDILAVWRGNPNKQMSRTGEKAKFGLVEIEAVSKRMRGIRAKINAAEQALRDEEKQGNFRNGASTCDAIANLYKEMKSAYLAYEAAFRSSRRGAKTRFEKSDDYARILMQPVTAANCGKMQKVAADAMKHAKSVGDDDLFELAEEIANTCRTKNPNRGAK